MKSLKADTQTWLDELQASGYKLTKPRIAVVEIMAQGDHPMSPAELYEQAQTTYPTIGKMTVYRTLEKLEELQLVHRLHNGCHTYVAAPPASCHLMICEDCGDVRYVEASELPCGVEESIGHVGFKVKSHLLQLFGVCAACQA